MAENLIKGTEAEWRAYMHERIKEVKENMSIKYWHKPNNDCHDWWDSIVPNDWIAIAGLEIGCVQIECRIDHDLSQEHQTISYYLNVKRKDEAEEEYWESFEYIVPNHLEQFSKFTTWEEIFNDMLWELIDYCIEYEIDYEADYFLIHTDICDELKDKLNAEFKAYTKYLKDNCVDVDEIISYSYIIAMKIEFRKAINELADKMTPKEIRQTFLEKDDILENLFQKFIKKETGEMDIYKEFILNTIKGEK